MAEIPSRLVGDSESPLDLVGAHSLARLAKEVDGGEPLDEWQVGIVEDAVCRDRKLIVAVFAVKDLEAVYQPRNRPFATRTFGLIWPAKALQEFAAEIIIGERVAKLDNGHRRLLRG
jgi:hypothetical protein